MLKNFIFISLVFVSNIIGLNLSNDANDSPSYSSSSILKNDFFLEADASKRYFLQLEIRLDSIENQSNTVLDTVDFPISASGGDSTLVFRSTGLPMGLELDSLSGKIQGVVDSLAYLNSPYQVSIKVDDSDFDTTDIKEVSFLWEVLPMPSPLGVWQEWNLCIDKRAENAYVEVGDKFYLIGGLAISESIATEKNVLEHDPVLDVWSYKGEAPERFHHFQAAEIDGLVYVCSAWISDNPFNTSNDFIYIYDPLEDSWVKGRPIPPSRKRGSSGTVAYNGKIYIAGGNEGGHGQHAQVKTLFDVYDPTTGSLDPLPDLPIGRDHVYASVLNDKLYMAAGRNTGQGGSLAATVATVDEFDFSTNTWTTLNGSIPTERSGCPVAIINNEVVVVGGEVYYDALALKKTEAFDPLSETWTVLSDMPTGVHASQAIVNNNVAYIAGGSEFLAVGDKRNPTKVFFRNGTNTPNPLQLTTIVPGQLVTEDTLIALGGAIIGDTLLTPFKLFNIEGNQGIIVTDLRLDADSSSFEIINDKLLPIVIPPGDSSDFVLRYIPQMGDSIYGSIYIEHSGTNDSTLITFVSELPIRVGGVLDVRSTERDSVFLQVEASGGSGQLIYSATGLPQGLRLDSTNGQISGIIDSSASLFSPYYVEVVVDDSDNDPVDIARTNFIWTIDPYPISISIASVDDQENMELDSVNLEILAQGGNGPLIFSSETLPPGLVLDSLSGEVFGVVDSLASQTSPYNVLISVDDSDEDNSDVATQNFIWTINPLGNTTFIKPNLPYEPKIKVFPTWIDRYSNNIFFEYLEDDKSDLKVKIFNLNGELLQLFFFENCCNQEAIELELASMTPGVYVINFESSKNPSIYSMKFYKN